VYFYFFEYLSCQILFKLGMNFFFINMSVRASLHEFQLILYVLKLIINKIFNNSKIYETRINNI
jgi:hypothetical protein